MVYMGDALYWDNKFSKRENGLLNPECQLLLDIEQYRFTGTGIELACGDGRNLIPLAERGFRMTGVDFSPIAMTRLKHFLKNSNVNAEIILADLTNKDSFKMLQQYDFVIINHYKLIPDYYDVLMKHIRPNGYLWVNGFTTIPKKHSAIRRSDLLQDDDFKGLQDLCIDTKRYQISDKNFTRYLFQK